MIDLCIAVGGPNVDVLLPIFVKSLRDTTDLRLVKLHGVDRGAPPGVLSWMKEKGFFISNPAYGCHAHFDDDTARTCQYMLDKCGDEEWAFISHYDVLFKSSLIGHYMSLITDKTGQIGRHGDGLVGYRRSAVRQCYVGFKPMSGFYVVKDYRGDWRVMHGSDHWCSDKSIRIEGFDVGELIALNLAFKNWQVITVPEYEWNDRMIHYRGGSGYHGDEINAQIRSRAVEQLHRMGIPPIPV